VELFVQEYKTRVEVADSDKRTSLPMKVSFENISHRTMSKDLQSKHTNGPNRLECYKTREWNDMPRANTVAYWSHS
jgi:hypothetical protein